MEIRYKINSRVLLMAMLGAIMVCSSYLMFVYNPLAMIIKKILAMAPGSILYYIWVSPPYEVFIKANIFNVTNADKFLAGEEPLHVQEAGPYIYREKLFNYDSKFMDNGTVLYKQKRFIEFVPELSVGNPETDWLISPNIPLVGITSSLQDKPYVVNLGISSITRLLGSKSFVNLTIHEYLWGYEDPLVSMANKFLPQWIDFPKFGILDRMMALDNATNTILMNVQPDDPMKYTIDTYNGSPGLPHWGYRDPEGNETVKTNTVCNTVKGTYESGLYTDSVNRPNGTFRMYRRAFCRPVKFAYEKEQSVGRFSGYQYRVASDFLATPEENPDNSCYCVGGTCSPKGMAPLSPCYYGIPVTISQPHFYNADPILSSRVVGMKPNAEKHDSTLVLHQELGIPLKADLKIQINLVVPETSNSRTEPFNSMTLPLFWLELQIQEAPWFVKFCLVMIYEVLPVAQQILIYLFVIVGLALVSGSGFALLFSSGNSSSNGSNYSPIPIIPMASQYFRPEIRTCK